MIRGSCLCAGVLFQLTRVAGPLELCHCTRCRKASGAGHMAGLGVRVRDYQMTAGHDLVREFALPVRERPPAYKTFFCSRCGSPVPMPNPSGDWFEIPAGVLDDDPGVCVERHIFVEHAAPWDHDLDSVPGFTAAQLHAHRARNRSNGDG